MTRPRLAPLLALLAAAAPGCLFVRQPAGTPERPTVLGFDIQGTRAISEDDLKQHLVTQESTRKLPLLRPEPQYLDPDALDSDRRRIARYYEAHGYFQAEVGEPQVREVDPGRVEVRIDVSEGPPVRVARVEVTGLEGLPEAQQEVGRLKLPIAEGEIFEEADYDAARAEIERALRDRGWAHAEVAAQARVDPALGQARVRYAVTPGRRYTFGGTFVAGAAAIPRSRIREEAEAFAKPGQTFDASRLDQVQTRVYDLGVFGGVRVAEGPPDEERRVIPLVVSVREAPFRTVRAGPGITVQNTSRWEADALVGWSHRNWLGGLRKLNLDASVGYAWLPNIYAPDTQGLVGRASADFTQPEFFTRFLDLNVHAELERGRERAYDFFAERLRLGLPLRLGRTFGFFPSFNLELYQLAGRLGSPDPNQPGNVLQLSTCPGQDPDTCLLAYFEERFSLDLRDDPLNTTRGIYLSLSLQQGITAFGNGATYFRVLPEARAFASPWSGVVLAARLRFGVIQAPAGSDLPLPALLTSGGPSYMRGYYTRQLAPTWNNCAGVTTECNAAYTPIGGAGLVDGGVELRFPIIAQLGGAAFLDFGHVTFAAEDALNDLSRLQYAVGAGIRYRTVLGPLRLDFAYLLPRPDGSDPGVEVLRLAPGTPPSRTRLVPSGLPDHTFDRFLVHLSIGEAF